MTAEVELKTDWKEFFKSRRGLFLVVTGALLIRLFPFYQFSLWTDEFATYWVSTAASLSDCIERATVTQGQSPLFFIIVRMLMAVLPNNEFTLRLLSLIPSLIIVVLIYEVTLLYFKDHKCSLVAAALAALHAPQIFYSIDARPYALGMMFVLFSQFFYYLICVKDKKRLIVLYIASSILVCYTHYIFGVILLVQNLHIFYSFFIEKKKLAINIKIWVIAQVLIALSLVLVLFQVFSILSNSQKWNWMRSQSSWQAVNMYLNMFDLKVVWVIIPVLAVSIFIMKINWKEKLSGWKNELIMLSLWILIPFLFAFCVSGLLDMNLLSERYLVIILLPFYILVAKALTFSESARAVSIFSLIYLLLYTWLFSVPNLRGYQGFSFRIKDNWKQAMAFLNENYRDGDSVILRSGFVKENWIPTTEKELIKDYGRAPFRSFYWKKQLPKIYNLTYSMEKQFYPYYDKILAAACSRKRVWIIGVDPPNSNFPVYNVPPLLHQNYGMVKQFEKSFGGVYLSLMKK